MNSLLMLKRELTELGLNLLDRLALAILLGALLRRYPDTQHQLVRSAGRYRLRLWVRRSLVTDEDLVFDLESDPIGLAISLCAVESLLIHEGMYPR